MIDSRIPPELRSKFEFHNFGHALEILSLSRPNEWFEILSALQKFQIPLSAVKKGGGNESDIPKIFDHLLRPKGWKEIRISGDLIVKMYPRLAGRGKKKGEFSKTPSSQTTIEGYIDGHNIDYVKNSVAFDLEWNSKDQTFDRDLLAMRTYFDCGVVDAGIIVTRSEELNDVFKALGIKAKYGASTTWMGKLLPRLKSRRNGGCPILAVGIRKPCIVGGVP